MVLCPQTVQFATAMSRWQQLPVTMPAMARPVVNEYIIPQGCRSDCSLARAAPKIMRQWRSKLRRAMGCMPPSPLPPLPLH